MANRGQMHVYRDPTSLARGLADFFVASASLAMAERGAFCVALAGGNTPSSAYELLARDPLRTEISWSDVFVYFGDERCVPPDDEQSNYRMAQRTFLSHVPIPAANIHRIRGEIDPGLAANEYASTIRAHLGNAPQFDLMLLGLGRDGHTASLFPGMPLDDDDEALVRGVYAPSQIMWRVTMTPKLINMSRQVAFAVEGAEKAQILANVYEGPLDFAKYPAQIVQPASGRLSWFVDHLAAGMLKH